MVQGHFWTRVAQRIRNYRSGAPVEWSPASAGNGAMVNRGDVVLSSLPMGASGEEAAFQSRALDVIQRSQEKVTGLVESIQTHLAGQQERTARMAEALDRLADHVSQLPRAARAQAEAVTALAGQLENTAVRTRRLDNHLAQLPEWMEAQRRTEARIAEALGELKTPIENLGRTGAASMGMAEQFCASAVDREDRLVKLFAEHTRRLTRVMSGAIALAVLSAVFGLVAVLK